MMKHLAAMGTVREVDVDSYIPAPLSNALVQKMFRESILLMYVSGTPFGIMQMQLTFIPS